MSSLQQAVLSGVAKLRDALGDLAIPLTLRRRTKNTHVPGTTLGYTDVDSPAKGVITKFRHDEVDGTMVQAKDLLMVLFPPASGAIPQPNDIVVNGSLTYRVMNNNPMYAGSEIAFNLVHVRPPI